jgi:branched-chain amino acid transport system substrate-binding protein
MNMSSHVSGSYRADRRGRGLTAAAAVATALVMTACSSGGSSTTSASTAADTSSSSSSSQGGGVTDLVAYTGGKAGAADNSLAPVTVGWLNQQGGPLGWPAGTQGAQAAVTYVNKQLGGIGGHPLKLSTCFVVQSEQEGNACGLKFANDTQVKAVLYGTAIVGDQAAQAVLKGSKPILMANSISPGDAGGANVFISNGNPSSIFGGLTTYLVSVVKAKTVSVIYPQDAQSTAGAEALKGSLQASGVTVKSVGFDPATTNLTAAATAAGVLSTDAVVPLVSSPPACVAAANAFKTLNVTAPVVSTGSFCFTPPVAQGLGGEAPRWMQLSTQANVADSSQPDVQAYIKQSSEAGLPSNVQSDSNAALAWGLVMTATRFLNGAGGAAATEQTIAAQAKAFTGPMLLGGTKIACGTYPTQAGLCGFQTRVFQHTGGNSFKAVSTWLDPTGIK